MGGDFNLYRYVVNRPLTRRDTSGLDFQVCSRPIDGCPLTGDPFRHYYIKFDDGKTFISFGEDENNPGQGREIPEFNGMAGESCGKKISSTKSEDAMMQKWAQANYNQPYDPNGYNCKSFIGDVMTKFPEAGNK